jgi:hypothetical protein
MAKKYHSGTYTPVNPEKYVGTYPIFFRSSWENRVFVFLDNNPNIINWASESIKIPYFNPFTNKQSVYIPDLMVVYDDKNGKRKCEIIEIKPSKETTLESAGKSTRNKAAVALNACKWKAAQAFAQSHGMSFRVLTEQDIFGR